MIEKRLCAILQGIANEGIPPENVDLWPRVREGLNKRILAHRKPLSRVTTRVALPVFIMLVLLTLSLILAGPERALAALRGLLGYIPGIGLVDEAGGLRVLADPVSLEQDGITITVEQALLDSERTVIIYIADGIPAEAYHSIPTEAYPPHHRSEDASFCSLSPQLHLSDGSVLQIVGGRGSGRDSGYESRLVYPPIPPEISEAIFFIPCLNDTSPGAAPENWEVALHFIPAPADVTVVPVFEISTSTEATVTPDEAEAMGMYLEKVIELEGSYILAGTFRQNMDLPGAIVMGISAWPAIVDAEGLPLPYETPSDLDLVSEEVGVFPWAYEIPKGFASPLTITLEAVDVEFPADATFQLDVGADPQVGQEWMLDQEFELSGHVIHLVSAVRLENGYEFNFRSDTSVSGVSVEDTAHVPVGGFGEGQQGEFSDGFEYADPVPAGLLAFRIRGLMARYSGPWTLTWEPPEGGEPMPTRSVPQACLTLERWLQAAENPAPQPKDLAGKMIVYGRIQDDGQPLSSANAGVFVVDLEDGSRQVLGPGAWPSLSPDGAQAAYSWSDGLHVVDLDSGENRLLPGTSESDYNPHWSPDGLQIAFAHTDDRNLYVVDANGSNLQQVTEGREYEQLIGWLPEGLTLTYVFPGPEGLQLRFMDLLSGTIRDGFVMDAKGANAAISPDGQMIAFVERVPGGPGYGLYLSRLDGSDRRFLISQLEHWWLSDPFWSPDGAWLIASIVNTDLLQAEVISALFSPDTCQVIPLEGIEGYVHGWSR
jgi:hypothetical protein